MPNRSIARALLRGIVWGFVGTLFGSLIFGLIVSPLVIFEVGKISLSYTSAKWDSPHEMISYFLRGTEGILEWLIAWAYWSLVTSGIGAAIVLLPGVLGGIFLSLVIHFAVVLSPMRQDARPILGVKFGSLVGMLIGIVVAMPLTYLLLFVYGTTNLLGYLAMAFAAFLITIACSTFVGWRLILGYSAKFDVPYDPTRNRYTNSS